MTTGEGGLFVTNDDTLHERVLTLGNHGRARGEVRQFWPSTVGFKYKISNIQAAIGLAQAERLPELIAEKRRIFSAYASRLRELPLRMNPEPADTRNGFWMPTIVVDAGVPFDREALLASFAAESIDGRVFFWPLSMTPPGRTMHRAAANTVAYATYARAVNLPSYHGITDAELDRVSAVVRDHLQQATTPAAA